MSDESTTGFHANPNAEHPASVEVGKDHARIIPLRPSNDRRGKYPELRALIDAGRNVDVSFERS